MSGRALSTLLVAVIGLSSQTGSLPYHPDFGASFRVEALTRVDYGRCGDGAPDFRNLTYELGEDVPGDERRVSLVAGRISKTEGAGGERLGSLAVELAAVHTLPGGGGGATFWLVALHVESVGGSSSTSYHAQVMRCRAGVLEAVQRIVWDARVPGGGTAVARVGHDGSLRFVTPHYLPGDAHCCVSAVDEVSLRWEGSRYGKAVVGSRRIRGGETP